MLFAEPSDLLDMTLLCDLFAFKECIEEFAEARRPLIHNVRQRLGLHQGSLWETGDYVRLQASGKNKPW